MLDILEGQRREEGGGEKSQNVIRGKTAFVQNHPTLKISE